VSEAPCGGGICLREIVVWNLCHFFVKYVKHTDVIISIHRLKYAIYYAVVIKYYFLILVCLRVCAYFVSVSYHTILKLKSSHHMFVLHVTCE